MSHEIDPRVDKTRRRLRQALITLLQTQKVENISVRQLTTTAAVTRGTFYLHYKDKPDFIDQALNDLVTELFAEAIVTVSIEEVITNPADPLRRVQVFSLTKALSYIDQHAEAFRTLLLDQSQLAVSRRLQQQLTQWMQRFYCDFEDQFADLEVPVSIQIAYYVSSTLGLVTDWLANDMMYTPRYLTKCLKKMHHLMTVGNISFTDFFVQ
ncbi:TetR/AcrR family transcriptional regulator [Lactiplantibacillus mudanjiangensis]|uniref:Transcription regulator [Lactobacillus plantarum JDM1] n=1 Tax=Lactiplantibacillus mudanjiangensis TaxID=1296538 RepID=A0A660E2X1_9LACO|nr:TetR/AcrR family transcriptional regulator [Lactiplantibacillus mudanjiangensis]VDG24492.1 transcription regulator [Lactobacillus plantarum JDM1] [Lactiplantibacillus mudanjiangensis]VDG29783.1 transcription regulator [Lactobacillus plantarum JDM1] [Lactiplantibacillus mudanjiangensis]VDG31253.1 transcription regulator [Lactobacillus plantarum JDM1] [Lactiplantibacillus mudanjiangensis]